MFDLVTPHSPLIYDALYIALWSICHLQYRGSLGLSPIFGCGYI